jgi:hypothetical protein
MGDIGDLISKLRSLTSLKIDRAEREALRQDCARRYDWAEIAQRTSLIYESVLSASRAQTLSRSMIGSIEASSARLHQKAAFPPLSPDRTIRGAKRNARGEPLKG